MATWSIKRQFYYGGTFIVLISLIIGGLFWKVIYQSPTCGDGYQNGDEKGIDCGGSCKNLCASDTLTPVVLWSKIFHISGDVYTVVSYIQNPNINSKNSKATYRFSVYDKDNKLISTKDGETSIPKNKKFAVFETGLIIKNVVPKSADFEFLSFGPWEKDATKEQGISVEYGSLTSTTTVPKINGTVSNTSLQDISALELDVFVLDGKENVVAASRSFVNNLVKGSSQNFVFTWPKPFDLGVEACTNPLDIAIDLDKSGSMKSESINPPEPFGTVLRTAEDFVKNLTDNDQVSVVSFGNNSKIENILSKNKVSVSSTISSLFLSTTTVEQTNISDALTDALNELESGHARQDSQKVIVLLTDGIPTLPVRSDTPDFPRISAIEVARKAIASGVTIYTIGLGKSVDEGFLKSISTDDSHYFLAPNKETLSNIYNKIGSSLCPKKPNVITVIYRTL